MRAFRTVLIAVSIFLPAPAITQAAATEDDRARLYLEQQRDALNLDLQQSIGMRRDLSARDSGAVDRLQLHQRLERQQLEQQQVLQGHLFTRRHASLPPEAARRELESQRGLFALEREMQAQRFALDQQRLLQSMRRQPLQGSGSPGRPGLR